MGFVFLTKRRSLNWYRFNRELHRDLGYLAVGLTIVFAVSGIALNHIDDWNPNYIIERHEQALTLEKQPNDAQLNEALLAQYRIDIPVKASYWGSPDDYKLFFKGGSSLAVDFANKTVIYEQIRPRPVFKQFNHLHLNKAQNGWIAFSDIYAGILLFLAISSLFMVKGKYSPWRPRKGWLLIVGGLIPLVYMFF